MTDSAMTIDQFKELLLTYGSNFSRWPAEQAAAAKAWLIQSPEAQQAYTEADSLDTLFAQGDMSQAPDGLLDKIMQRIDTPDKK